MSQLNSSISALLKTLGYATGKPFFVWYNSTRMHVRTHMRPEHIGRYQHGDSEYIDDMIEHDKTELFNPGRNGHFR